MNDIANAVRELILKLLIEQGPLAIAKIMILLLNLVMQFERDQFLASRSL